MDVHFSSIFGVIKASLSYLKDGVEKFLFYRAYEISTVYHSHRQLLGRFSHSLTTDLEYDLHWDKYYLRRRQYSPVIWVRALNNKSFSKMVLSVTALNNNNKFQNVITLYDVDATPTQVGLPSIPVRQLDFKRKYGSQYNTVTTKLVELHDSEGKEIRLYGDMTHYLTPFDRLEVAFGMERGYIEKWGEVFHLGLIEMNISEQKVQLVGSRLLSRRIIDHIYRSIFSTNWIVKMIFWRKNHCCPIVPKAAPVVGSALFSV